MPGTSVPYGKIIKQEKLHKITLVVLAWNHWSLTSECLASLRRTDLLGADVIVVDNGSTDETPRKLAQMDWVRVITLPENTGFVRGNNAALEVIDSHSDVVLLNNDIVFTQSDWLASLIQCAYSHVSAGVVGCRLRSADGQLVHTGSYILPDTMWGQQNESGRPEKDIGQFSKDREVQGVVFACVFIKRATLDAIGGLSPEYISYFEDTDYCLRARQAGFSTVVCGNVTLKHNQHGSTMDQPGVHMKLFQRSRAIFTKKWRTILEEKYRYELCWQSVMNFPSGYAMSCREFMRTLDQYGIRMIYEYVYGPGSPFPIEEPDDSHDYRLNVIRTRKANRNMDPKLAVVYGQGDVFARNKGRYKIGYTMLEVDGFPKQWVNQANHMDEVWVPTEFNRQHFLECGLKRPIHCIPLGVNPHYFHSEITGFPNPFGEYLFLSNFEWGERKAPWLLLKTFSEGFTADEPVRLLVKINNRDPSIDVCSEIKKLGLRETGGKISYLVNRVFPYYQLAALYRSADCFISAGRGEGWDMPLMEAMACGLPSIATDWGAHTEFTDPEICYLLKTRGTIPAVAKCPYYDGFSWADPDPEHLRLLLRHVYENQEEARQIGMRAAEHIVKNWTWELAVQKIQQRIEHVLLG